MSRICSEILRLESPMLLRQKARHVLEDILHPLKEHNAMPLALNVSMLLREHLTDLKSCSRANDPGRDVDGDEVKNIHDAYPFDATKH